MLVLVSKNIPISNSRTLVMRRKTIALPMFSLTKTLKDAGICRLVTIRPAMLANEINTERIALIKVALWNNPQRPRALIPRYTKTDTTSP